MILGIDEAGRGPWAGPLVVGAVVLGGAHIEGLTDSKKLTKKKRQSLYAHITAEVASYASGWVSSAELDSLGMRQSLRLATRRAVEQITAPYSEIIIDGTVNFLAGTGKGDYVQTMAKADMLVPSVSAASIIAKVERDRYMIALDEKYPEYGFRSNFGYGVAKHRGAIEQLGVTPEHRLSFAPLVKYAPLSPVASPQERSDSLSAAVSSIKTTKAMGDEAEGAAVDYLLRQGHHIIERNWRTKFCEIDIVSQKDSTVYFVEVKHRKDSQSGDGLAYITPSKLKQMQFAARLYAHSNRLPELNLRLAAMATTGAPPEVVKYVEV